MAESSNTRKAADVGAIHGNPAAVSAAATSDHTCLGGHRESRLKNPLREICTVGSVTGESCWAMADLHAHEAGNGGQGQGRPTVQAVLFRKLVKTTPTPFNNNKDEHQYGRNS